MSDETQFVCPHCKQQIKHCAGMTFGEVMSLRHNKQHQDNLLDRLRAEIAELKRLNGNCDRHIKEVHAAYMLEHSGLRSEIEKLRAALKPFAIDTKWLDDKEDDYLCSSIWFRLVQYRAASAALKETE